MRFYEAFMVLELAPRVAIYRRGWQPELCLRLSNPKDPFLELGDADRASKKPWLPGNDDLFTDDWEVE